MLINIFTYDKLEEAVKKELNKIKIMETETNIIYKTKTGFTKEISHKGLIPFNSTVRLSIIDGLDMASMKENIKHIKRQEKTFKVVKRVITFIYEEI